MLLLSFVGPMTGLCSTSEHLYQLGMSRRPIYHLLTNLTISFLNDGQSSNILTICNIKQHSFVDNHIAFITLI